MNCRLEYFVPKSKFSQCLLPLSTSLETATNVYLRIMSLPAEEARITLYDVYEEAKN